MTLIELLVVISIIGVLLALSLPLINRIVERARTVICMNNQKQIFLAVTMYANDNDNYIIPTNQHSWLYRDSQTNFKWYTNILSKYIRTEFDDPNIGDVKLRPKSVWVCPSVRLKEKGWGAGYGLNERAHPYPCLYSLYAAPPTLVNIRRPADVFSIADSREWNGIKWVTVIGVHPPNAPNLIPWGQKGSHEVAPRHLGKVVLAFFDNSVCCYSYEQCKSNHRNMFANDENGDGFYDF